MGSDVARGGAAALCGIGVGPRLQQKIQRLRLPLLASNVHGRRPVLLGPRDAPPGGHEHAHGFKVAVAGGDVEGRRAAVLSPVDEGGACVDRVYREIMYRGGRGEGERAGG